MRSFLRRIWQILTAPVRWLLTPFRALRDFINHDPEDVPIADVFSRTIEEPSLVFEHLEALRRHLLRAMLVLILAVALAAVFAQDILAWLSEPIGGLEQLQAIEVTENIGAFMRVSLLTGFALSLPYIGLEIFAFMNPGLRRRERIMVLSFIPTGSILFVLGVLFTYYVMLPAALPFLLNFLGISTAIRPANYIRFVTGLMFWIGLAFQFPLVIYAVAALGFIDARMLIRGWRYAILVIAVIAAAATPTIDPINMGLVMLPMIVLYFLSIGLAVLAGRGHRKRKAASQPPE
ncbi:MAG: twin-arginine translocase subunit TatC [Anaerolineales bacterium]|nr:twin-arginine translocase subunit TatC [Anaerolineales bacterium]